MSLPYISHNELAQISENVEDYLKETSLSRLLNKKNIVLTGGTGFFGKWLLQSFLYFNSTQKLSSKIWIVTRDSAKFKNQLKGINDYCRQGTVHFIEADFTGASSNNLLNSKLPDRIDYVIHAATPASAEENSKFPLRMFDTITNSTRLLLNSLENRGVQKFLFVSSGAVYGAPRLENHFFNESDVSAPSTLSRHSAYGEGKRTGELISTILGSDYKIPIRIARCFAFVGPYLPLDTHFAIGNFLANAWRGETIRVRGDGLPVRSYLYASELVEWLWVYLLAEKAPPILNIGSGVPLSMSELARILSEMYSVKYEIEKKIDAGVGGNFYVPDVSLADTSLGLKQRIFLEEGVRRFENWFRLNCEVSHV